MGGRGDIGFPDSASGAAHLFVILRVSILRVREALGWSTFRERKELGGSAKEGAHACGGLWGGPHAGNQRDRVGPLTKDLTRAGGSGEVHILGT